MNGPIGPAILLAGSLAAGVLADLRWLRVAQREHYLPGSVTRFARRWWSLGPNRLLAAAAVIGVTAAALGLTPAGLVAAGAVAAGPFGLSLRGRTSALAWTRRLKLLAATTGATVALLVGLGAVVSLAVAAAVATLLAIAAPLVIDGALAVTSPLERRLVRPFVDRAAAKLESIHPTVVAITGSYGKTSTKEYVAHLLSSTLTVVPTPHSYNNRAGLARTVNEQLTPGTDVFVAEMGTYGPGEIAEMCSWIPPDIAVITAIGPVHIERMGSEERIAEAKAEILGPAKVVVLNTDSPWLRAMADRAEALGTMVWRCSAGDRRADVCAVIDGGALRVFVHRDGVATEMACRIRADAATSNVACAVAVALELGVTPEVIARLLADLPTAAHRREVTTGRTGATIIDDTYNANPAGAAGALDVLDRLATGVTGRRIVVTPGMVELGGRQAEENARFAQAAAKTATDLVVVGQSNAAALVAGARGGNAQVVRVGTRHKAVAWVSRRAAAGDVVLYENDLPDHYP